MLKDYGPAKLLAAVALVFSTSTNAVEYKVVDLGLNSSLIQINNLGQVIGSESSYCCSSYYFWSASTGKLSAPGPVKALDNNGLVLAYHYTGYLLWSPAAGTTVKLTNDTTTTISALNDVGGYAGSVPHGSVNDAAAWISGSPLSGASPMVVLPAVASYSSPGNQAVAINNSGAFVSNVFVGGHADWRDDEFHPVLWTSASGATDLGPLGSVDGNTLAVAMNDAGAVVGYGKQTGTARTRSFIWTQSGGMQDLGSPYAPSAESWRDFDQEIRAFDVNSSGSIVGYSRQSYMSSPDAFFWSASTGNVKIDSLLAEPSKLEGWHISSANSINDNGWIVGSGVIEGQVHGIMLVPVPEPTTWALLLLGGVIVMIRVSRNPRSSARTT